MIKPEYPYKSLHRCMACENYVPGGHTSMKCKLTDKPIENDCGFTDFALMPEWCPYNKNCHSYCNYAKHCRYAKGEIGLIPEECARYWKIEDILNDAQDILEEERKAKGEDEEW